MKKILLLITVLQLGAKLASGQQDAQMSQYMFNGIYVNPGYAGYKEQLNIQGFYRNQWTGITGSPKTVSLTVDAIANDGNVGLAFQVSNDELGAQRNLGAYASYAYRIRMNESGSSRLSLGLSAGVVQLGIDGSKLNPNDVEVNQPVGMQTTTMPDARIGVYFANDRFFAGLSADNLIARYLNKDHFIFVAQPAPHFYFTAGTLIALSETIQLKPSVLLKDDRGGPTSLDMDAFFILGDRLWIGGGYRTGVKIYNKSYLQNNLSNQNAAVGAVQVFASSNFRIGYAYDLSVGALQGYSGGTHELTIGYYFTRKNERMLTPRYF